MAMTGDRPPAPDGRRGGPLPVGEPVDEDRQQVAAIQRQQRERLERERQEQADAAEPAGVPPSDAQRDATEALRQRSAELRGPAARALRRQPVPVGVVYDDERELVEQLHSDARDRRLDELDVRGIVDPSVELETAGFPQDLPHLPGHELYGNFTCPSCGSNVERAFPGYVDWDLAARDLVCPQCGGVVLRGGGATSAPPDEAPEPMQAQQQTVTGNVPGQTAEAIGTRQYPAPGLVTDHTGAENHLGVCQVCGRRMTDDNGNPTHSTAAAQPLTADERAELAQLRADRDARQQAEASTPATPEATPPATAEPGQEQPQTTEPSSSG